MVFGATRNQMARKRLENKRFQLRQDLPRPRGPPAWAEMPSANLQSKKCLKTNGKRMKKMRPEPVGWPGAPFQGPNNMPEAGMPENAQKMNTFAAEGLLAPQPARRPPAPLTKDGFYC